MNSVPNKILQKSLSEPSEHDQSLDHIPDESSHKLVSYQTEPRLGCSPEEDHSPASGIQMRMRMHKPMGSKNTSRAFAPFNLNPRRTDPCSIPRTVQIRIRHLKLLEAPKSKCYLAIGVRLRKTRLKDMMRSNPIACVEHTLLDIPLDLQFSLEYTHRLKGEPNVLQLVLQRRRRRTQPYRNIGYIHLPMDEILQKPVYALAVAYQSKSKLKGAVGTMLLGVESVFGVEDHAVASASAAVAATAAEEDVEHFVEQIEITDSEEDNEEEDGGRQYSQFQTYLSTPGYADHEEEEKETTFSYKIAETMSKVRETGTKLIDRIRTNLRRKSDPEIHPVRTLSPRNSFSSRVEDSPHHSQDDEQVLSMKTEVLSTHSDVTGDSGNVFAKPVREQWEQNILRSSSQQQPMCYVLVDQSVPFAKRLLKWSDGSRMSSFLSPQNTLSFVSSSDIHAVFSLVVERSRQMSFRRASENVDGRRLLRLVLLGGDWAVHALLCAYIELLAKEPRSWDHLLVYYVPLHRTRDAPRNQLARAIASRDQVYKSLFFSSEWKHAVHSSDSLEPALRGVESCISRYVKEAQTKLRVPIACALIEEAAENSFQQTSLPFLRDFVIDDFENTDRKSWDASVSPRNVFVVNVDYWHYSSKKQKLKKSSLKVDLVSLAVRRLNSAQPDLEQVSDDSKDISESVPVAEAPPRASAAVTPTFFDTLREQEDVAGDEEAKCFTMRLQFVGKDKRKFTNRLIRGNDVSLIEEQVTKVVVYAAENTAFSARIDGTLISNLKFVSFSPEWSGRLKHFPIAGFQELANDSFF